MKTFEERLNTLTNSAIDKIVRKIDAKGVESEHYSEKCLKVKDDNLMFDLEGGRYLAEVKKDGRNIELVDDSGYNYNYTALDIDDLFRVIDHLLTEY